MHCRHRFVWIAIAIGLALLVFLSKYIISSKSSSKSCGISENLLPEIYPTGKVIIVQPQGQKKEHNQTIKITKTLRSAHQKRLFMEIDALLKKRPLQWKEFLTLTVIPLFKSAPCFCPPCDEVNEPQRSCDKVQSQIMDNLSNVTRSAARLNLHFPFQQVPSSSNLTGGAWKPSQCRSKQKIAIIIPFRDRWEQVNTLLQILHPFLQRQNICYRVFVIEQYGNAPFNKGRLNNAGFLEVAKRFRFDCVIYHDTDIIPFSDRNRYHCRDQRPLHMVTGLNTTNFRLPYMSLVGGAIAFTVEQYVRLNGYSNLYWGWGLEDDDMDIRMKSGTGFRYTRPNSKNGYYQVQSHLRQGIYSIQGARRSPLLSTSIRRYLFDGLNSVEYKVIGEHNNSAYTHILIYVGNQPLDFVGMET